MSAAPPPIEEIEDRLEDLTEALREAGDDATADELDRHAEGFSDPTAVRREVNALRQRLERWRANPELVPDTPKVLLAANRLEDVCIEALQAGVIEAAPLTLGEQSRRKLGIVFGTLLLGSLVLLVPILLIEAGVDFSDLDHERELPALKLPRGEELVATVSALAASEVPNATSGVLLELAGGCTAALGNGACSETKPRLWPSGRMKTYEIRLPNQAFGLLFSLGDTRLLGGVGEGTVLLAATGDTPEGRYEIPFQVTYAGYTPQRCELADRLLGSCPKPRVGEGEKHAGIETPLLVVEVVPGAPGKRTGEQRLAEAEAEEARAKAQARAEELAEAMSEIQKLTRETDKHIKRKRWLQAKANLDKLSALFAPLDGVALTELAEDLPLEIGSVRVQIEQLQDELDGFEDKIFDRTFSTLTAEQNQKVPEERLLKKVANQFRVPVDYVQDIYTSRATEIQERLDAKAKERQAALEQARLEREKRCGELPEHSWKAVQGYLEQLNVGVEVELGECMTARLTDEACWEMRCDYERRVEISVERPKIVTKHSALFFMRHGQVIGHRGG